MYYQKYVFLYFECMFFHYLNVINKVSSEQCKKVCFCIYLINLQKYVLNLWIKLLLNVLSKVCFFISWVYVFSLFECYK